MDTESPGSNQKEQHDESAEDSDDRFEYEEDFLKGDVNLVRDEDEEDLATLQAIQHRAKADSPVKRPCPARNTHQQLPTLDFLRSFLFQHGMNETLECLENEWAELVQKGELDEKVIDPVPEVYAENQSLAGELKKAVREKEECTRAACIAAEALQRAERTRDAHRLQHRRMVQEKNKLIEEIKRLKMKCDSFKLEVKRMSEKYNAASKQVMQVALEMEEELQGGIEAPR